MRLRIGDEIKLAEAEFAALFKAFFAEIEAKFSYPNTFAVHREDVRAIVETLQRCRWPTRETYVRVCQ